MKFDRIAELGGTMQFLQNEVIVGVGINQKKVPFFNLESKAWKPKGTLPLVPRHRNGTMMSKPEIETVLYDAEMRIA